MFTKFTGILSCILITLGLTGYSGPIPPNAPPPFGPEGELTTVGPDEYGYLLSDDPPDYAFEDISLTGNTLFFSDTDNGTAATGIVPFPYYDQVYSLVYVNVNGFLSFTDIPARKTSVNKPLPTDSRPNNLIAAYWSNIILGASGKVLARNETAPNRTIIQWNNVTAGAITGLTFEIILFADGDIRIVYQPVSGSFTGVTAGIEDADGVSGLNYALPSLASGESVLISRPEKVTGGVHVKARPQVSSNFFTENEAWFTVTISNTTTSALASDAYFLDAEVLESDPANPPLPPLNWDLEFYSPDCSSVIPSIPALAKDTSTQLCMRVLAGDGLISGDYVRMKVTVTSQADSNRSSIIYLQATIGSPFAQLYQDSASGLRLDFTNGDGQTSFEMANPYGGSHMAMNMLSPNHYIISWLEGSSIKYRMVDKYPGMLGPILDIPASPDDIRNLIDLTPAVAGSRDGYAGILYIVNKYQTNGLGHTELNANVWFALMNPDGSMVKNEEGDDMYPLNMTNNTAYLDLVMGYSGDAIPQFQDPRIVPVGQDKMGLVWHTNFFPSGGSSMDKIDYVLAKTDGSDYSYWEIPGWDTSHRHFYPATTYLDDGRFMITYTNYTGASNPWVIYYSVIDSDGLATSPAPVWSSGDTNGWQVDLVQLGNGRVLLGWQDISTSAITYAVMDNSLTGLVADPVTLVYNDYPGHTNYRAGGYPSVTRSANGNGIITWQDQDWQEQLYYALVGPDGSEVTPPSLYRRVGPTLPKSQISTNTYGNAPLIDFIDVSLEKAISNNSPDIGSVVTFTLKISNATGFQAADNLSITDIVPDGYSYLPSSINGGTSRDDSSPTGSGLTWTIATLPADNIVDLTYQATVLETGSHDNYAEITAYSQDDYDSIPGNGQQSPDEDDDDTVLVTVSNSPSVNVTIEADTSSVDSAGDVIHYTVTVDNTGNVNLTGISVADDPDVDLVYDSGDTNLDGILDEDETWVYKGSYTVSQSEIDAGEPIHIETTVDTDQTDPVTEENDVPVTNFSPIANLDNYDMHWSDAVLVVNAEYGVLANDSDANGTHLTVDLGNDVIHGSLNLALDGSFSYSPATGFHGPTDSFTYRAYDGLVYSNWVTVTIDFTNTKPNGVADDYVTLWRQQLTVYAPTGILSNDGDLDGDLIDFERLEGPTDSEGHLFLDPDGSFVFIPDSGFHGDATFTYRLFDGLEYSNPVTVTIHVIIYQVFNPIIRKN